MNEYGLKAKQLFLQGYNCAQAIVIAFEDKLKKNREELALLSSSFGGGMGRLREVCGSVSGMFIVIGLLFGYSDPKDQKGKIKQYETIQRLANKFKEQNGSIICKELLKFTTTTNDTIPEIRNEQYYQKRPCADLVYAAACILSEEIENEK